MQVIARVKSLPRHDVLRNMALMFSIHCQQTWKIDLLTLTLFCSCLLSTPAEHARVKSPLSPYDVLRIMAVMLSIHCHQTWKIDFLTLTLFCSCLLSTLAEHTHMKMFINNSKLSKVFSIFVFWRPNPRPHYTVVLARGRGNFLLSACLSKQPQWTKQVMTTTKTTTKAARSKHSRQADLMQMRSAILSNRIPRECTMIHCSKAVVF